MILYIFFPIFIYLQISHIIREIRQFQQTAYKIDHQPKVRFVFWLHPNPNPEFGGISRSGRAVHYCLPVNLLIKCYYIGQDYNVQASKNNLVVVKDICDFFIYSAVYETEKSNNAVNNC